MSGTVLPFLGRQGVKPLPYHQMTEQRAVGDYGMEGQGVPSPFGRLAGTADARPFGVSGPYEPNICEATRKGDGSLCGAKPVKGHIHCIGHLGTAHA